MSRPGPTSRAAESASTLRSPQRLGELALAFLRLGCTSFGGPIAHLGYLHTEFVRKRAWLDDAHYGDLVALCQFLPGPASSQLVFALGMQRAGLAGALLASSCFTLPSALLMIGFAYGVAHLDVASASWLHGLKLAAVPVVAQAVWGMGKKLCPDRARASLCFFAAGSLLALPGAWTQVGVIVGGAAFGAFRYRDRAQSSDAPLAEPGRIARAAPLVLGLCATLLALLPALVSLTNWPLLAEIDRFYRAGALVFGGGHVVLPLLRAELVPEGWLSDARFLAGYGAAQALPGPLFAFSAYLGASIDVGIARWLNGVVCLLAIFAPAWLLIGGALPLWQRLRSRGWAPAALAGANAAVVGVLLAALYDPVMRESIRAPRDVVAALLAFCLLETWKLPAWLVVLGLALGSAW
ncbi:MAG TPA: chromate efflux transporter [Polyangiales bacterium]